MVKLMIAKIIRDLEKSQDKLLDQAAIHVRNAIKRKVSQRGGTSRAGDPPRRDTGDLYRGIKWAKRGDYRLVGVGKPAQHAHLLEFGTAPRVVKNYAGKQGIRKDVGRVIPRPFMRPTFAEEADKVAEILSKPWA
jgi:HK97 gp10 family phage protein